MKCVTVIQPQMLAFFNEVIFHCHAAENQIQYAQNPNLIMLNPNNMPTYHNSPSSRPISSLQTNDASKIHGNECTKPTLILRTRLSNLSNNNIFFLRNKGVQIISEQASTSPQTELVRDQSTASLLEGNNVY